MKKNIKKLTQINSTSGVSETICVRSIVLVFFTLMHFVSSFFFLLASTLFVESYMYHTSCGIIGQIYPIDSILCAESSQPFMCPILRLKVNMENKKFSPTHFSFHQAKNVSIINFENKQIQLVEKATRFYNFGFLFIRKLEFMKHVDRFYLKTQSEYSAKPNNSPDSICRNSCLHCADIQT